MAQSSSSQPSKAEWQKRCITAEAQLEFWRSAKLDFRVGKTIEGAFDVIKLAIKVAGCIGIAYLVQQAIVPFAGVKSDAAFAIDFLLDFKLAWPTMTAAALLGWWRERKSKHEAIARLSARPRELEQQIDPGRSSSNLTDRGRTNPADQS